MDGNQLSSYDYATISDYLIHEITSGHYKVGEKLPSEMELSSKYNVNRYTIRQALKRLVNLELAISMQGKGYFVVPRPTPSTYVISERSQFTQSMEIKGKIHKSKLVSWQKDQPNETEMKYLKIHKDDTVYRLEIIRYVELKPMTVSTTVLVARKVPHLERYLNQFHSLYTILEQHYRFTPKREYSFFQAILPSSQDAKYLNISNEVPLMGIESVANGPDRTPVEFTYSRIRGDMNKCFVKIR